MPEIVVVNWRLPRRVVAVRMRGGDELPRMPFAPPFVAYGFSFDPAVAPYDCERLCERLDDTGAHAGISVFGPAALSWDDHAVSVDPNGYRPGEALDGSFLHSGWPFDVTAFVVLAIDADDDDWQGVLTSCRRTLAASVDDRLHFACGRGEVDNVARAIADGWPLDQIDRDLGYAPLHYAAMEGQLDVVRMLLDAGVDVDTRASDRLDETALRVVAEEGRLEVVRLLLDAGADPLLVGSGGMHSLAAAERYQPDGDVVRLLRAHIERRLRS